MVIPLEEGRYYSLRDFCSECNRQLKTTYRLDRVPSDLVELTDRDRRVLQLLSEADSAGRLLRVQLDANRMVIALPNSEDEDVRRKTRRQFERLFGVSLSEWPPGMGLHLPDKFSTTKSTVLLIPGLESNSKALGGLAKAFRKIGVQVLNFDYPNDGPLAWSGRRLRTELKALFAQYPKLRLVIVAHSMGGLISRHALEAPDTALGRITDVFMLGTPHRGSSLARGQPWLELFSETLPGLGGSFAAVRDGLGEAAEDLEPGSKFLAGLNAGQRPQSTRYHNAIGRKGFVTPEEFRTIEGQLDRLLDKRGVPLLERAAILGFWSQSRELRTGDGDGCVAISSARLAGAHSERVFDLNHWELMSTSPDKRQSEVFLWIVKTMGWNTLESLR